MAEIDPNLIKEELLRIREKARQREAERRRGYFTFIEEIDALIRDLEKHDEDSFHDPDCATLCDGNTAHCLDDHSCSTCAGEADVEASSH